ncbi:MAG: pyridoxamine 5'-phosphate oxidase family protein [Chloroflexota bacterium]|nr:pyridoxamine 5'-phosphate oxidase family protein [Chloroflexota bacterium]
MPTIPDHDIDLAAAESATITSIEQLEALFGQPKHTSVAKESEAMTPLEQAFIRASPFHLLATSHTDGTCDVSPRGDPPGSVHVLCERTLILPERAGNKRVDSLRNIVVNPHVGLLFLVPGLDETLRVNGTARLTTHTPLLARYAVQGKTPELAIIVHTEAVYMHCARAFRRSKLWDPATWPESGTVPQMPSVLKTKLDLDGTLEEITGEREERYRQSLY